MRETSALGSLRPEDVPEQHLKLLAIYEPIRLTIQAGIYSQVRSLSETDTPCRPLNDPTAVLAWYVNELQRDTRVTGQFAVLVPIV